MLPFHSLNAFLYDTCVIIALAYLLTRGRALTLLFERRHTSPGGVLLGLILGGVGLAEAFSPGVRYPYAAHTLMVTFATIAGGAREGLVAAMVVVTGAFALQSPHVALMIGLAVVVSVVIGELVRKTVAAENPLAGGALAGMLAQSFVLLLRNAIGRPEYVPYPFSHVLVSVLANGFGMFLLQLIINDALVRSRSEQLQREAERAHALIAEAQLAALRARVHPHFLFNTLTSIAGLCGISPERAEMAIIRLGELMRRALEMGSASLVRLDHELEYVQAYVEIEQQRLGSRLQVEWRVDAACDGVLVPPFAVQMLVENAINHGIGPKWEPGRVVISARRYPGHTLIAVTDDGVGMDTRQRRKVVDKDGGRPHGLRILNEQLSLLYGRQARLRLFGRVDAGTTAAFVLPQQAPKGVYGGSRR